MPGFKVSELGEGPTHNVRPFYTYTWELDNVFSQLRDGASANEPPLIYVRECTLPTFAVEREDYESPSIIYKFAAQANWEDIRLTFYDIPNPDGGKKMADILKIWREAVWSPEGGIKLSEKNTGQERGYKGDTTIKVFNADNTVTYTWRLKGSWPQSIKEGELTYTDSDAKIVEVIVVYDWAELDEDPGQSPL